MAIQNYKKFINKRQNDELTDITPDFGELVVGKDRVIIGLGDNTIYNTKEKELELERLQYYGDKNIIPNDESYFTVNAAGNTITGLTDTGKAQSGNLVIPYKINGKIITSITGIQDGIVDISALDGATDKFTKITLPNTITSIGNNAFISCSSLTSINIPNSVTSIGYSAFHQCSSLTSINIPNSVTSIEYDAFSGCTALTSVNISNSLTEVPLSAFSGCSSLTSINIPNSVTSIGDDAFTNCDSLTSINIPNSITNIGSGAFSGPNSLTSVNIPNSVISIGDCAFHMFDEKSGSFVPKPGLTIYCEQNSYAETYAKENGFNIVYTDIDKDKLVGQKTENGGEIFNDYTNNVASGDYSHAEGYKTKAYANYSHVEGNLNWTYGIGSHAEGNNSNALTDYSHAEGKRTTAGRKCFKVTAASGTPNGEGTYTLDSIDNLTTNLTITLCESNGVGSTTINATYAIGTITAIDTTNKIITVDKFFTPTMNDEDENANSDYYIYANDKPTYGTQTNIFINTHAEGQSTEAFGIYSHAEGYHSKSYGEASHAECASQANGKHSHSEGSGTTANGLFSHTEGFNTQTGLDNGAWAAHAEGWWTKALSRGAHSEGNFTYANKEYSHAEGDSSKADGESSHSEGKETTANTIASHAEGYKTNAGIKCFKITSGTGTVNGEGTYILDSVEGISTDYIGNISGTIIAVGKTDENKIPTSIATIGTITALDSNTKTITVDNFKSCSLPIKTYYIYIDKVPNIGTTNIINYTHVEGIETQAFGYGSHAEGYCSLTKGNYSHAEGASQAIGECSHSEGNSSIASGQFSHAEGFNTQSKAIGSHSEGEHTQANAEGAHAEGKGTIANGGYSHAEGDATEANEIASHAEGRGTKASAPFQHVEGKYNIVDDFGDYAHIIGNGESDTARSNALTVDWNGNLWIAGGLTFGMIDTLPTASASYRGKTIFKKDDTNGDKLYICIYNGSAYEWKEL